jgi:endogenous inhibitor of DNA gyrase (YacG/DUF329 family)
MTKVNCPQCSAPVEWKASSPFRPFCSERCKMRDLGAWSTERYRVADNDKHSEQEKADPGDS